MAYFIVCLNVIVTFPNVRGKQDEKHPIISVISLIEQLQWKTAILKSYGNIQHLKTSNIIIHVQFQPFHFNINPLMLILWSKHMTYLHCEEYLQIVIYTQNVITDEQ